MTSSNFGIRLATVLGNLCETTKNFQNCLKGVVLAV
nr:MAG TPA: hypothetical protein [Caudoviricetes sp.]